MEFQLKYLTFLLTFWKTSPLHFSLFDGRGCCFSMLVFDVRGLTLARNGYEITQ